MDDVVYYTNFGDHVKGYKPFNDYLRDCDLSTFKNNEDFNYMTEHIGSEQIEYGKVVYNKIINLNLIKHDLLIELIKINDSVGNPTKYKINDVLPECSPNTLKYVYFGLLNIKNIFNSNLSNFDFIEIGGGYGGQCVILLKLFEHFNIIINKYILIDIIDTSIFQKKYVDSLIPNNNVVNIIYSIENLKQYNFLKNSFLFSSFAFSEIKPSIRNTYYTNIFDFIKHGLLVWQSNFNIDLPNYIEYKSDTDTYYNETYINF